MTLATLLEAAQKLPRATKDSCGRFHVKNLAGHEAPLPKSDAEWSSIVAIVGDPGDYNEEELGKLIRFAEEKTARHNERGRSWANPNFIIIGKEGPNRWVRKMMTWTDAVPNYSRDINLAIMFMNPY